jgi:hypothetical protein
MPIVLCLVFICFRTLTCQVLTSISGNWSSGFHTFILTCGENCEETDVAIWREDRV